jgi:hypothetical protein
MFLIDSSPDVGLYVVLGGPDWDFEGDEPPCELPWIHVWARGLDRDRFAQVASRIVPFAAAQELGIDENYFWAPPPVSSEALAQAIAVAEAFEEPWSMLQLALLGRDAVELIRSDPALAFALVHRYGDCPAERPSPEVQRWQLDLLGTWRRGGGIARRLGLSDSPAALRLLRKVPRDEISHHALDHFHGDSLDPAVHARLRHLPRLSREVLDLACNRALASHVAPRLLLEVAASHEWAWWVPDRPSQRLADCLAMADRLGRPDRVGQVRSLRALSRLHDGLLLDMLRTGAAALPGRVATRDAVPFPAPPVPGTDEIQPIPDVRELEAEGRTMRHCILSYAERVRAGRHYVYRVLSPDRATLTLERPAGAEVWRLGEVNGPANAPVSEPTRTAIQSWLERAARR